MRENDPQIERLKREQAELERKLREARELAERLERAVAEKQKREQDK